MNKLSNYDFLYVNFTIAALRHELSHQIVIAN